MDIEEFADRMMDERRVQMAAWIENLPSLPMNAKRVAIDVLFDDGTGIDIDLNVTMEMSDKSEAETRHARRGAWQRLLRRVGCIADPAS